MSTQDVASPGLTVRPATTADLPAARAFMLRIFEQDYGETPIPSERA